MIRRISLTVMLIFSFITISFAQSAIYDAEKLKDIFSQELNDSLFLEAGQILAKYLPPSDEPLNADKVKVMYLNNPFIPQAYKDFAPLAAPAPISAGGFISSIGKMNISTFADGLAKFLVERAKEEVNIAFFEKLRELKLKYPEFEVLFPHTQLLLNSFRSWEYANIINTLKEAFDKDFKALLTNLIRLKDMEASLCDTASPCYKRITAIHRFFTTKEGIILTSSLQIANGFLSNQKIPDIISLVTGKEMMGGLFENENVNTSIQFLAIISNSLRSNSLFESYISYDGFRQLMSDPLTRQLFFALIFQQVKTRSLRIGEKDLSEYIAERYVIIEEYITTLLKNTTELAVAIQQYYETRMQGSEDLSGNLDEIFLAARKFLLATTDLSGIDPRLELGESWKKVVARSEEALEIAHDIAVRNYNAAVVATLNFLSVTVKPGELDEFKAFFVKYGSFAANVVLAKTSDEVQHAIESVALPAGSASIKKNARFNISLNAYLGGFYGREYLSEKENRKWGSISGVAAPVGVAFSWPIRSSFLKGGAASAFLSVIDVGAFASFRLKDDSTETLPEVNLKNIFAPGGGLVLGLPKWPVSIGYLWQMGPSLREISPEAAVNSDVRNHRWTLFLAVDIPIVNFYTKSR